MSFWSQLALQEAEKQDLNPGETNNNNAEKNANDVISDDGILVDSLVTDNLVHEATSLEGLAGNTMEVTSVADNFDENSHNPRLSPGQNSVNRTAHNSKSFVPSETSGVEGHISESIRNYRESSIDSNFHTNSGLGEKAPPNDERSYRGNASTPNPVAPVGSTPPSSHHDTSVLIESIRQPTAVSSSSVETPVRQKHSKFFFFSDQNKVPSDLRKLQERAMKRRRDFLSRMHNLDCHLASMTSKYAEEKMDLQLALRDTLDRIACQPLEAAAERLVMERESSACRSCAITALERRLSQIDNEMVLHVNVKLNNSQKEHLDVLQEEFYQDVVPSVRIENSKSDKIEGGVSRRFENSAGLVARQFHEESATRRACVEVLRKKAETAIKKERHNLEVLRVIAELRASIKEESLARKAKDQKIVNDLVQSTITMRQALLQAIGDDS